MAIAAADAADRCDQLTVLTERLTELIAAQAQAFEQRRPQDARQIAVRSEAPPFTRARHG